jgi:hypothetical protein
VLDIFPALICCVWAARFGVPINIVNHMHPTHQLIVRVIIEVDILLYSDALAVRNIRIANGI